MVGVSGLFSCILFSACRVNNGSQPQRTATAIVGQIQLEVGLVSSCVLLTDQDLTTIRSVVSLGVCPDLKRDGKPR